MATITDRRFEAIFFFVHWTDVSLGVNIDLRSPNICIHVPFGFLRVGWSGVWVYDNYRTHAWGIGSRVYRRNFVDAVASE